jgi:hypothetical protein
MTVDSCQSTNAEPPGFIDTKSVGETHKLLLAQLAGKGEVHMRMIAESFGCGLCGGTHSYGARDRGRKAHAMAGDFYFAVSEPTHRLSRRRRRRWAGSE